MILRIGDTVYINDLTNKLKKITGINPLASTTFGVVAAIEENDSKFNTNNIKRTNQIFVVCILFM